MKPPTTGICPSCSGQSFRVSLKTVFHHVVSEKLQMIQEVQYWFCTSRECDVVYFAENGHAFQVSDLREQVSIKASASEDFPLCYCFGFSSSAVQKATATKTQLVSEMVRGLIARKLCECEIRNPSGRCCLSVIIAEESRNKVSQE